MDLAELFSGTAAKVGAGAGAVAVGGTAIGLGVHFGTSRGESIDEAAHIEGHWDELMKPPVMAAGKDVNYSDWSVEPNFVLGSYRCAKDLFPGVAFPESHTIHRYGRADGSSAEDMTGQTENNHPKLKPQLSSAAATAPKGNHVACNITKLNTRGRQFLMRSENAFGNDRVGIVFWMGAKTVLADWKVNDPKPHIYLLSLMAFLENEDGHWRVKGGFGWREIVEPSNVPKLLIRTSEKAPPILTYSQLKGEGPMERVVKEANWTEFGSGNAAALKTYNDGISAQNYAIDTSVARGYKDTDIFLYRPDEHTWWKRFEGSGGANPTVKFNS